MPANCQSNPTVPMKAAAASWLLRTLPTRGPVVAKQQIGLAGDAAEIANTGELPIHPNRADERRASDLIAIDVVDLKTARAVTQQHVGSVPAKETTERHKLPIGSDLAQVVSRQEAVAADIVDLVLTVGAVAQDHVRGGAGGRRRIRGWSRWSLA